MANKTHRQKGIRCENCTRCGERDFLRDGFCTRCRLFIQDRKRSYGQCLTCGAFEYTSHLKAMETQVDPELDTTGIDLWICETCWNKAIAEGKIGSCDHCGRTTLPGKTLCSGCAEDLPALRHAHVSGSELVIMSGQYPF